MNAQLINDVSRQPREVVQQAQEQLQALLARSAKDMEFRRKLLGDPRAAVSEFTGRPAPENMNLVFVENKADATLILPDPVDSSTELSETELHTVAGGIAPAILAACLVAFCMGLTSND